MSSRDQLSFEEPMQSAENLSHYATTAFDGPSDLLMHEEQERQFVEIYFAPRLSQELLKGEIKAQGNEQSSKTDSVVGKECILTFSLDEIVESRGTHAHETCNELLKTLARCQERERELKTILAQASERGFLQGVALAEQELALKQHALERPQTDFLGALLSRIEPSLVEIVERICHEVLGFSVDCSEYIYQQVTRELQELSPFGKYTLELPESFDSTQRDELSERLRAVLTSEWSIESRRNLKPGECVIRYEEGEIRLSANRYLDRLLDALRRETCMGESLYKKILLREIVELVR